MEKIDFNLMENTQGGFSDLCKGAGLTCGLGILFVSASFAVPLLFAFTAPLTAGSCTAVAACAGL